MRNIIEIKWSLRACRVQAELTQKAVAEAIGVSEMTVRRWEQGKASPSMVQGQELSKLYDVPMANMDFTLEKNKNSYVA